MAISKAGFNTASLLIKHRNFKERSEIMNNEYQELLRTNFENYLEIHGHSNSSQFENEELRDAILGLMYLSWIEATRQADERHAIK